MLNTSGRRVNKSSLTWWYVLKTSWKYLCKTSWRRLENVFKAPWRRFRKTSWRGCEDLLKTPWQDVLKTSTQRPEDVLKMSWRRFCKTSWRHLEDVWPRWIYWSWPRRIEDVLKALLKTYGQGEHIRLDQDVFWRRKMCSRRLTSS